MPTVIANGIEIYYEIAGSGPRLLFISGTGGDLRVKPNVFDSLLTERFELLSYDQRGLGRTGKPSRDYSMADYAQDAAALLDQLGWGSVAVMGVSFGGMVAQELALREPQRVRRLALACTSSGGEGGASYPLLELEALEESERALRQLELADVRYDRVWREANPERLQVLLLRGARTRRADRDVAGARRQLRARAEHDTYDRLPQLQMPVLLAGGEFDGIAPKPNMEALADRIAGARLRFFNGGHLFLIQDPSAYPYIIQWLNE